MSTLLVRLPVLGMIDRVGMRFWREIERTALPTLGDRHSTPLDIRADGRKLELEKGSVV